MKISIHTLDSLPTHLLKSQPDSPPQVAQTYRNICLLATNFVITVMFLLSHLVLMYFIFSNWGSWDYMVIIYSSMQIALGVYSVMLCVGDPALQIVLLRLEIYVNWVLFVIITITAFSFLLSIWLYFTNTTFASSNLDFLLY